MDLRFDNLPYLLWNPTVSWYVALWFNNLPLDPSRRILEHTEMMNIYQLITYDQLHNDSIS